jgi:NADPH2:quinone reductase
MMKALVLKSYNGSLELVDIPRPRPAGTEVLVRIAASGLNPLDTKIRAGAAAHAKHPVPLILGIDMAGTVVEVGNQASDFKVGDEVYGMTGGVGGIQGSLAQFAVVDPDLLSLKPRNLTMREAAALPLAFITAYSGIVDRAKLQAGETVLVQGGAGGVGHIAVQLAVALGGEVFATINLRNRHLIEEYGAVPIDYIAQTVQQYVDEHTQGQGFDLVVDTVGGATLDASFVAVKRFGHVVSALGWGTHALAPLSFKEASYSGIFTLEPLLSSNARAHHGVVLREATRLVEARRLFPRLDPRQFEMRSAEAAYGAITSGVASGKIVVNVT